MNFNQNINKPKRELNNKAIKVGIIIDDGNLPILAKELIKEFKSDNFYEIKCIILQKKDKNYLKKTYIILKKNGLLFFLSKITFKFIEIVETFFLKFYEVKSNFTNENIKVSSIKKITVSPKKSPSGYKYTYRNEDIEKIKSCNLDLLIRAGSGILNGEILTICRFGILSFHHGDNRVYRGGPPGFWEVFNRNASTGFIIQKLSKVLDGGDVLYRGNIQTSFLYVLNKKRIYNKSIFFMRKILISIGKNDALPETEDPFLYLNKIYKTPLLHIQLIYIIKTLLYLSRKIILRIIRKKWKWGIAYQFVDSWKNVSLNKSKIIKNPPNTYLADPFVISKNNQKIIFAENFDIRKNKGRISAFKLNKDNYESLGVVLEEKFHLSYPFLFEDESKLYMCPETRKNNDIRIYECIKFPNKWILSKVLIKNISAADSNIFFHNNRWWIMTNIDSSKTGDTSSELHIFYSKTLHSNNWISHPKNPIIFDSRLARNGGMLKDKSNNIYRVFQVQGFDMYGKSFGIAKINLISPDNYKETKIMDVSSDFLKNIYGSHTFSHNYDVLAFDFVKL